MKSTYRVAGVRCGASARRQCAGVTWLALGTLALLGPSGARSAEAQTAGSPPPGLSRVMSPVTGPALARSSGDAPNSQLRQNMGANPGLGSPFGQLNYGREPVSGVADPSADLQEVGFFDGDLHNGQWSGLIERNFRVMRRTSPFPQQFAGGIFNRHSFVRGFGPAGFGFFSPSFGGFSYGGYAFDYGPSVYDFVPSVYSLYGSWYPPYLPQDRVYIIERDVVHEPAATQPADHDSRATTDQPARADDGEYYLSPRSGETLDDALAAIRQAWMNGDFARLKSRLAEKGRVRIFLKGKYKYSVDAADFSQMTQDAMKRIDTISFTLDHVKRLNEDRAFVSGEHSYYDPDHVKHEVYVSYTLENRNGRWQIVEAGSSTEPITSHGD